MTPQNKDSSFSAFAFGLTIGIIGALAFGTKEGREILNKLIDSIPEKIKNPPIKTNHYETRVPVISPEETPHHAFYNAETPPPPEPAVRPMRPEPFTSPEM